MFNIAQLGGSQSADPISLVIQLLWFVLIFVSIFYGQKIQGWKAAKVIDRKSVV